MYPFDHRDILGAYPDADLLKAGGQKVVYRVTHPTFGAVALKIGQYSSPQGLERIKREVTLLKDIDSEYYPKNFDFQIVSSDRFYILEEYIDSKPLTHYNADYKTPKEVVELIIHLVLGLKLLWDRRVVHRDIKPDNVLITGNGKPKIIDLGIARLLDLESLTRTLAMRGPCTPVYAAPEQLLNRKTKIDFRADQFNLGIVTLQLLLKGDHPFDPTVVGSGVSTVENIIADNWAKSKIHGLAHSQLQVIVRKLLGHEPFQRYRNEQLLLRDLQNALETYA